MESEAVVEKLKIANDDVSKMSDDRDMLLTVGQFKGIVGLGITAAEAAVASNKREEELKGLLERVSEVAEKLAQDRDEWKSIACRAQKSFSEAVDTVKETVANVSSVIGG